MAATPARASDQAGMSTLRGVRVGNPDKWQRVVELYKPTVYRWAREQGLRHEDAQDVVQEVFADLSRQKPDFRGEDVAMQFCSWLQKATGHKIADRFRDRARRLDTVPGRLEDLPEPGDRCQQIAEPLDLGLLPSVSEEEQAHRIHQAIKTAQREVKSQTWLVFCRLCFQHRPAAEVALEFHISVVAARQIRCRMIRRLRELLT